MSKISSTTVIAFTGAALISLAPPAFAQADDGKFGKVHFETSCNPEAQKLFDRAMLYQHSFWYRASQKVFEDVLKADPECGVAYWGIALSLLLNPHGAPPVKNLAEGAAAITKGQSVGAKTQRRERDYIDALAVMYADYEKIDHRTRIVAYSKAMEQLAQRYPNDDEAQIYYALSLNTSASAADKTYANQLKGAAILEPIFARQPHIPVSRTISSIFTTTRRSPRRGLTPPGCTPKSPPMRHTRSTCRHISSRVSAIWQKSIHSQYRVAACRQKFGDFSEQLHAMDYRVYAYLQLGQELEREGRC